MEESKYGMSMLSVLSVILAALKHSRGSSHTLVYSLLWGKNEILGHYFTCSFSHSYFMFPGSSVLDLKCSSVEPIFLSAAASGG